MAISLHHDLELYADSMTVAHLFALDPAGFGGVVLRSPAGAVRDAWMAYLLALLHDLPAIKIPCTIDEERLIGGLDLGATLKLGKVVHSGGVLQRAKGGLLICAMAERLPKRIAARLAVVMDTGALQGHLCGPKNEPTTYFGIVALDESAEEDECIAKPLSERCAFRLELDCFSPSIAADVFQHTNSTNHMLERARCVFQSVEVAQTLQEVLCQTALALGIGSLRAALFALRAARGLAALDGRTQCEEEDVATAARLVLAPLARLIPEAKQDEAQSPETPQERTDPGPSQEAAPLAADKQQALQDRVLAAAQTSIPQGLMNMLISSAQARSKGTLGGQAGALRNSSQRGRPVGIQQVPVRSGVRLNVLATLRAAAPWQVLRRRAQPLSNQRVHVIPDDFRATRYAQRTPSATVFAIDASGSSALHRLAEAKGAVELLLAQCYVRRDQVAVVAFRGQTAQFLLPLTRSLARAKRELAGLPGGGATPLAAGIDAALLIAHAAKRKGTTPTIVLLTDGRANMARNGQGGRTQAHADALQAAACVREANITALVVDISPQPQQTTFELATRMGARYLPLPHADARVLSQAVLAAR